MLTSVYLGPALMEVLVRINMEVTVAPAGQDLPERIAKKVISAISPPNYLSKLIVKYK